MIGDDSLNQLDNAVEFIKKHAAEINSIVTDQFAPCFNDIEDWAAQTEIGDKTKEEIKVIVGGVQSLNELTEELMKKIANFVVQKRGFNKGDFKTFNEATSNIVTGAISGMGTAAAEAAKKIAAEQQATATKQYTNAEIEEVLKRQTPPYTIPIPDIPGKGKPFVTPISPGNLKQPVADQITPIKPSTQTTTMGTGLGTGKATRNVNMTN